MSTSIDWKAHARRSIQALGADWDIRPASGAPAYTVRGIFAGSDAVLDGADRPGVHGQELAFRVMAEDLRCAAAGDALERGSERYRIAEVPLPVEPSGHVTLRLELDS